MSLGRLLLLVVGGLVSLGLLVVAADVWILPWLVHQQSEVLVPELGGMDRSSAERELVRVGLTMVVGEEIFDQEQPIGVVLEQSPPALSAVRAGRPVRVVLSKGEAVVQVPDVVGLSLRQSELLLLREGLRVGRVSRSYDPLGTVGVVAQRPHAGSERQRGAAVDLLLREGSERIHHRMPDLIGQSLVRVRDALTRAGFEVRKVTYRSTSDAVPGTILDQWPPAGSRIPAGGSIELVASNRG